MNEEELHLRAIAATPDHTLDAGTPTLDMPNVLNAELVETCSFGQPLGSDTKAEFALPAAIGRFQIRRLLGQGAFGRVYRAYDPNLDRDVALKVPKFAGERPDLLERFYREARAAARLRHPHIVAVHDAGRIGEALYIASEFVDGVTLQQRLELGRPAIRAAAQWIRDLAAGLAYAHGMGVTHRDIKPANVMLAQNERAMLTDFGLAKRAEDESMTVEGMILGTPAYMSPEQARGDQRRVGPKSDQYSLGVMLYELFTGQRPFSGTMQEVIRQIEGVEPPAPRRLNPDLPADLEAVCLKAMAKAPADRYGDCDELAADLTRWLVDKPVKARRIGAWGRLTRYLKRAPYQAAGIAGAAFVTLLLAIGVVYSRSSAARRIAVLDKKVADESAAKLASDKIAQEKRRLASDEENRRKLQEALADWNRGLLECRQGDSGVGALYLARAVENVTARGDETLALGIRADLAAWTDQNIRLRHWIAQGNFPKFAASATFHPHQDVLLTNARLYMAAHVKESDAAGRESYLPLYGADDNGVRVRWLDANRVSRQIGGEGEYEAIAFRPDGKAFVAASWGPRGNVRLFDAETHEPKGPPFHTVYGALFVGFSPDGKRVVAWGNGGMMEVFNPETGQRVGTASVNRASPRESFRPDGTAWLALHRDSLNHKLELYDAASGAALISIDSPRLARLGQAFTSAFSPKGETCLIYGGSTLSVHDGQTLEVLFVPSALASDGESLRASYSHDGRFILAVVDYGSGLAPQGRCTVLAGDQDRTLFSRTGLEPDGARFNHDATLLMTKEADQRVRLWNTETWEQAGEPLAHPGKILTAEFSPDGKWIATGADDGYARVWNARSGRRVGQPLPQYGPVAHVAFSNSGRYLLTYAPSSPGSRGEAMLVWELPTDDEPYMESRRTAMLDMAPELPSGGKTLVLVREWVEKQPQATPLETTPLQNPGTPQQPILVGTVQAVDAAGEKMLTRYGDTSCMWEPRSGKLLQGPCKQPRSELVAVSADVSRAAYRERFEERQGQNRTSNTVVRVWNFGAPADDAISIPIPGESADAAAFDPTGATLWISAGSNVEGYHVATGKPTGGRIVGPGKVERLWVSPDGQRFAVLGRNGNKWIGQLYDGQGQAVGEPVSCDTVTIAAFRPDGGMVVWSHHTGFDFLDAVTGRLIRRAALPEFGWFSVADDVPGMAFSPDGKTLVAGRTGLVWTLDIEQGRFAGPPQRPFDLTSKVGFLRFDRSGKTYRIYSSTGMTRWPVPPRCVDDVATLRRRFERETGLAFQRSRETPAKEELQLIDIRRWRELQANLKEDHSQTATSTNP